MMADGTQGEFHLLNTLLSIFLNSFYAKIINKSIKGKNRNVIVIVKKYKTK